MTNSAAVNKCSCSVMKASMACRKVDDIINDLCWKHRSCRQYKENFNSNDSPQTACLEAHSTFGHDPVSVVHLHC